MSWPGHWAPPQPLLPPLGPVASSVLWHGMAAAPPVPDDRAAWAGEADILVEHGLSALAIKAATAGGVELPAAVKEQLVARQRLDALVTMSVEAFGPDVVQDLERAGIPSVVTKGPAVAQAYPTRGDRPYVDLDVVVAPGDFAPAMNLLRKAGFNQTVGLQARDYFDRYCLEAVNLFRSDGAAIDLHHHIPPWVWGRHLDFARLHRRSVPMRLRRSDIRVAHPVHSLLICALHIVSDKKHPGQSLRVWRDVATLAGRNDPSDTADEARRCRLDWWLRFILAELPPFAQPGDLLTLLRGAEPTPADRLRLRYLLPPGLGARHHLGQAFRVPVPSAIAFLFGEAFPSRTSIERKLGPGGTYLDWWRATHTRFRQAVGAKPGGRYQHSSPR